MGEYLGALNASDFRQQILSRSLCAESTRANCPQLLRILFPHSKRLPPDALRTESDSEDPDIWGMSYNSARDELFLADWYNRVVRVIRVRHSAGDLRDVYTNTTGDYCPHSVCHMKDSDTLLVCERQYTSGGNDSYWLVALRRSGSEWRETHRMRLAPDSNRLRNDSLCAE